MFNIIILGIASLLTDVSSEMVYPLIPFFLLWKLGASPALLGFIEGVAESTASLLKVFSGYWSDNLKKRKLPVILGYAFSLLGKFSLYLSASWGMVFGARILDRFGKGIRVAPRDALIADSSSGYARGRAFGLHRAMDTAGACLGIFLSYLLFSGSQGNFKEIFFIALIPAALGVAALFWVKEKQKPRLAFSGGLFDLDSQKSRPKISIREFVPQFKKLDKKLKAFLVISFVFSLANFSNQFMLMRAKTLGFNLKMIILLYLVYNISYAAFSYPAGAISDKIGRKTMLILGYIFYSLVYFGFAFAGAKEFIWALFILYGVYIGFTDGVEKALVTDLSPLNLRATFIGMHAALIGAGLFPASLIAGFLWSWFGASAPFIFGGIMSLGAAVALVRFI